MLSDSLNISSDDVISAFELFDVHIGDTVSEPDLNLILNDVIDIICISKQITITNKIRYFINNQIKNMLLKKYELIATPINIYNIKLLDEDSLSFNNNTINILASYNENNNSSSNNNNMSISKVITNNIISKQIYDILKNKLMTVEMRDKLYDDYMLQLEKTNLFSDIQINRIKHYNFLKQLPQEEQKSAAWYNKRNTILSASAISKVLGKSKYGTRDDYLMEKTGLVAENYSENMFVYHGKKYEKIANMIYEHLFNTKVGEFGLILYQNDSTDDEIINFLGASPDGVNSSITIDGNPNPLIGRMLEIKCPLKRQIQTSGEIYGTICPSDYWIQVQFQLACCKFEECDFWQCDIIEYTEDEWLLDEKDEPIKTQCIIEQNEVKEIEHTLTKGCIIQLMPKDKKKAKTMEKLEWYAKYIYPSNINMTNTEYLLWIKHIEHNWKQLYPQYVDDYYFDKILYWKLRLCHNVTIKRDIVWFKTNLPIFKQFWNDVLYYKNNPDKGKQLLHDYLLNKEQRKRIPKGGTEISKGVSKSSSSVFVKAPSGEHSNSKKSKLLNDDGFLNMS